MSDDLNPTGWPPQPFPHPDVLCESCNEKPAATVLVVREPEHLGSAEPWRRLHCGRLKCLLDNVVDTEALTRELAETLSGLDLTPKAVL